MSYVGLDTAKMNVDTDRNMIISTRKEFKEKFHWLSFAIGLLVAAIGMRYFNNVIDTDAFNCDSDVYKRFFVYVDIFLTAILLSGGSRLILEIIEWWTNNRSRSI